MPNFYDDVGKSLKTAKRFLEQHGGDEFSLHYEPSKAPPWSAQFTKSPVTVNSWGPVGIGHSPQEAIADAIAVKQD